MIGDAVLQVIGPIPDAGASVGASVNPIDIARDIIEDVRVVAPARDRGGQMLPVATIPPSKSPIAAGSGVGDTRADQQASVVVHV